MSLSCSCQEWEGDGWAFWLMSEEFEPFVGKRKKQCCSCGGDIVHLQPCLTFCRGRGPRNSIEEKILHLQDEKRKLAETFVADSESLPILSNEQWVDLL